MTDKQRNTEKEISGCCEGMPFAEMMQKMMGWQWQGCDCAKMMSHMMAMCSGAQDKPEEEADTEESQKV